MRVAELRVVEFVSESQGEVATSGSRGSISLIFSSSCPAAGSKVRLHWTVLRQRSRSRRTLYTQALSVSVDKANVQCRPILRESLNIFFLGSIMNSITPKLSWREFYILSSVSRAWRHAIRSRQVYSARVYNQCAETLVLVNYKIRHRSGNGIGLLSLRGNLCYDLPPIPNVTGGFPEFFQSVSLDRKVYVLGGFIGIGPRRSEQVYVMDLAGRREWKQCAAMIDARTEFGCGVMGGKMYVFGGFVGQHTVRKSEVYDPQTHTWTQIRPMTTFGYSHRTDVVGEEFFLRDGKFSLRDGIDIFHADSRLLPEVISVFPNAEVFANVYNPAKDNWREMLISWSDEVPHPHSRPRFPLYFMAREKLHRMYESVIQYHVKEEFLIDVHNANEKPQWTHLHSFTFASVRPVRKTSFRPFERYFGSG